MLGRHLPHTVPALLAWAMSPTVRAPASIAFMIDPLVTASQRQTHTRDKLARGWLEPGGHDGSSAPNKLQPPGVRSHPPEAHVPPSTGMQAPVT